MCKTRNVCAATAVYMRTCGCIKSVCVCVCPNQMQSTNFIPSSSRVLKGLPEDMDEACIQQSLYMTKPLHEPFRIKKMQAKPLMSIMKIDKSNTMYAN